MFCPNCSAPLKNPDAQSCVKCGALFGEGSAWIPVATLGNRKDKPLELTRSFIAVLLIFICVLLVSASLALRGTAIGSTPALVLALVFGVSGLVVALARSGRVRKTATFIGVVMLAVLVWVIGSFVVGVTQ